MRTSVGLKRVLLCAIAAMGSVASTRVQAGVWDGYAKDAQHSAASAVAAQPLNTIRWQTAIDLNPQYTGEDLDRLNIHYGSPVVTSANTVIVPIKTGATDGFKIQAHDGATGAVKWSTTTDYVLPPHNWTPSYSPTLGSNGRIYYPGAGGTILYRDVLDSSAPSAPTRVAFFGNASYSANAAAYNSSVFINTPITADPAGNIYFGYQVTGANPLNLQSGIARITPAGVATYTTAATASTDAGTNKVATNCAPALSPDGSTLYIAVNSGNYTRGNLLALNSTTLAPIGKVALKDPNTGLDAKVADDTSASPTVGSDGRVYYGALGSAVGSGRGWMLAFNSDLTQTTTPASFGWDDTATLVASSLVASYHGASAYLLMTKYNNYAGTYGGDGINKLAILDPNATQIDPRTGATVMKEVLTIAGPTPDAEYTADPQSPNAVREWCINTAVVDPASKSIFANSEDGKLYKWDLTTNTFTQQITLTAGLGEAYTPTLIGADGTV